MNLDHNERRELRRRGWRLSYKAPRPPRLPPEIVFQVPAGEDFTVDREAEI